MPAENAMETRLDKKKKMLYCSSYQKTTEIKKKKDYKTERLAIHTVYERLKYTQQYNIVRWCKGRKGNYGFSHTQGNII